MPRKNAFSLFANLSQFEMRAQIARVNPAEVPIRDPDLTTPSLTGINCLALDDWLPMVGSPSISGKIRHFLVGSGCRCVLHSHLRAPTCQPVKSPYTVEICCSPSAFNDARGGAFPDPVGRCKRTYPAAGWQSDLQTRPESATPRRQIISMRGAGQNSRGTSDRTQSDPELPGVLRTATNPFAAPAQGHSAPTASTAGRLPACRQHQFPPAKVRHTATEQNFAGSANNTPPVPANLHSDTCSHRQQRTDTGHAPSSSPDCTPPEPRTLPPSQPRS